MKTFMQVLDGKGHWKFQALELAEVLPEYDARTILIVDITGLAPEPQVGWPWDEAQRIFTPPGAAIDQDISSLIRNIELENLGTMRAAILGDSVALAQLKELEDNIKTIKTTAAPS